MKLRPRAKTEAVISQKPRISIFIPQQYTEEKPRQKTQISANNTHTTTRANIFDLKQPEERPKSTSNRKKKYIHVVSGEKNQQTDQKNVNIDILGSLKRYLQKNGNFTNKETTWTHSINPIDTPIKKLSIFQELEIDDDNRITTMREDIKNRQTQRQKVTSPPKFFSAIEPPPTQATNRQKIHLFSNQKLKTEPKTYGNENSIGKLRHLIKIVSRNI